MKGIHKLLSTYRSLSLLSSQLPVTNYTLEALKLCFYETLLPTYLIVTAMARMLINMQCVKFYFYSSFT
jgi:hypothetical protein